MKKHKDKRKLALLTVVFALTLITAFVYANLQETLEFRGTATLRDAELELRFVLQEGLEATKQDAWTDKNSTGTATLSADHQTITIEARFAEVNDELEFFFFIQNTGTLEAQFYHDFSSLEDTRTIPDPSPETDNAVWILSFGGTYEDLQGTGIEGGGAIILPGGEFYGEAVGGGVGPSDKPFSFNICLVDTDEIPDLEHTYHFELPMPYAVVGGPWPVGP